MKKCVSKGLSILLSMALLFAMLPSFSGLMASAETGLEVESQVQGAQNTSVNTEISGRWDEISTLFDCYKHADFSPFLKKGEDGKIITDDSRKATFDDNATEYTISSAEELAGLMVIVNESGYNVTLTDKNLTKVNFMGTQSFAGKIINLSEDIDLSAKEWVPIGKDNNHPFNATFQGKVNTDVKDYIKITGMRIGTEDSTARYEYAGLIGLYNGPLISNINIISTPEKPSEIYISKVDTIYVGGIVGYAYNFAKMNKCYNEGKIIVKDVNYAYVGGIVGSTDNYSTQIISKCDNTGAITVKNANYAYVGGIAGSIDNYSTQEIDDCFNRGEIMVNTISDNGYAGGIVGLANSSIKNCCNTGTISGNYAGGIAGSVGANNSSFCSINLDIRACYNAGATSGKYAGGIVGDVDNSNIKIYKCYYLDENGIWIDC